MNEPSGSDNRQQSNPRRQINMLLTLLLTLVLAAPVTFQLVTAFADQTVRLWQGMYFSTMQHDIQLALDIAGASHSGTILVYGNNSGATGSMQLNIPAGVTLIWTAELAGNADDPAGMIVLQGSGRFEIAEGAAIESTHPGSIAISVLAGNPDLEFTITGGTIHASADNSCALNLASGSAILSGGEVLVSGASSTAVLLDSAELLVTDQAILRCQGAEDTVLRVIDGKATISGGSIEVSGLHSKGVLTAENPVTISGGRISVTGSDSFGVYSEVAQVRISGGRLEANAPGSIAVATASGQISITGGSITAAVDSSSALFAHQGEITITGGTVTATEDGSHAVTLTGFGACVYLAGTVVGPSVVVGNEGGIVLEVNPGEPSDARAQSLLPSDGLTVQAVSESKGDFYLYYWSLAQNTPTIIILYPTQLSLKRIVWNSEIPNSLL
ncbi:MAG: carbohydrate-binding domain-containing protein [Coriobacteriia bacterium]|nr:carbohydrate-binding domain-containing protein [Coriobacteriia bacterium]